MTKLSQNVEMWAGDYRDLIVTITRSDNAAYSLAGASVTWILEYAPGSGSLVRKFGEGATAASGMTISTSTLTISLSPADTQSLEGTFYHEAEAKDSASRVATLLVGSLKINKSGARNY